MGNLDDFFSIILLGNKRICLDDVCTSLRDAYWGPGTTAQKLHWDLRAGEA